MPATGMAAVVADTVETATAGFVEVADQEPSPSEAASISRSARQLSPARTSLARAQPATEATYAAPPMSARDARPREPVSLGGGNADVTVMAQAVGAAVMAS